MPFLSDLFSGPSTSAAPSISVPAPKVILERLNIQRSQWALIAGAAAASLGAIAVVNSMTSSRALRADRPRYKPSPKEAIENRDPDDFEDLPYPLDALPGARDIDSPYGTVRLYEWGPKGGEKVLLLHGISTPSIALAGLANKLVDRGCRVMVLDLFGRGYSAAPDPTLYRYDSALYASQILIALQSSKISWKHFTLIGYSLGGALAADFTSYFPGSVSHLVLVAPGGLIRTSHITWGSRFLYSTSSLLPEWMVRTIVRGRLYTGAPVPKSIEPESDTMSLYSDNISLFSRDDETEVDGEKRREKRKSRDKEKDRLRSKGKRVKDKLSGKGKGKHERSEKKEEKLQIDGLKNDPVSPASDASLIAGHPESTVSNVVDWQLANHKGFVPAFISSIRYAPIHDQHERWRILGEHIKARQTSFKRVHLVLGENDPIIIADEIVEDAKAVLGEEAVKVDILKDTDHNVAIEKADEIAHLVGRWLD